MINTFNIRFWEHFIESEFIQRVKLLVEVVEMRLMPTLESVEKEAENVQQKEWKDLNSSAGEYADPAALAENAMEAGAKYYETMMAVRQGLLNMTATALYHLFEQQMLLMLRREILPLGKENDVRLFKGRVFKERLQERGIDITKFATWNMLEELRLVANSVKHAEGSSADELRQKNPRIFNNPVLDDSPFPLSTVNMWLYTPLSGDDLFVRLEDLKNYSNGIIGFWKEYISILSSNDV